MDVLEQRRNEDCASKSILSGPLETKNNSTGTMHIMPNLLVFFPSVSQRSFCDKIDKIYVEIVHTLGQSGKFYFRS